MTDSTDDAEIEGWRAKVRASCAEFGMHDLKMESKEFVDAMEAAAETCQAILAPLGAKIRSLRRGKRATMKAQSASAERLRSLTTSAYNLAKLLCQTRRHDEARETSDE